MLQKSEHLNLLYERRHNRCEATTDFQQGGVSVRIALPEHQTHQNIQDARVNQLVGVEGLAVGELSPVDEFSDLLVNPCLHQTLPKPELPQD